MSGGVKELERAAWRMVGGWAGGTVNAVALSPQFEVEGLVLAATSAGLFRSTDRGENWKLSSVGLADLHVVAVIFAPAQDENGSKVFAATNQGRLYNSDDGGQRWDEITAWIGLGRATALAISPTFAIDQTLFVATGEGVYRSQDGGRSWESSIFGLHDLEILCVACAPDFAVSDVLWAGTATGGLYRSRNGARSWRDSGEGLPDDAVTAILFSPSYAEDKTIFVGTESSGLYFSIDAGQTWMPLPANLPPLSVLCLAAVADRQRLVLGTDMGLFVSSTNGQIWAPSQGGEFIATSLASAEDVMIAGSIGEGVYRSIDGGQTWQLAANGLIAHAPPVVYQAARGDLFAVDSMGVIAYSDDRGNHWQTLNLLPFTADIVTIGIAGDHASTALWVTTEDRGLYRSSSGDGSDSWECIVGPDANGPLFFLIAPFLDKDAAPVVYLGADDGRVYRWTDAQGVQLLSPAPPWAPQVLCQVVVDATAVPAPRLIVVTMQPGRDGNYSFRVWESQDNSVQWAYMASLESEVPAVTIALPEDPLTHAIFLATRNRVIKIYEADGQLAVSQAFLAEHISITSIVASPNFAVDHILYAATNRGVYCSTDTGATWAPYGNGLDERTIVAIFPSIDNSEIHAVELGGAIWVLSDSSNEFGPSPANGSIAA